MKIPNWQRYRKIPLIINAYQWDGEFTILVKRYPSQRFSTGIKECVICGKRAVKHGIIDTLEGAHIVCPNDWIVRGLAGEYYPVKPDIFEKTYMAVKEGGGNR